MKTITKVQAEKVLSIVDQGLTRGQGKPKPGFMCVEAAVCYAFDEEHGDEPTCVDYSLRSIKIELNDNKGWIDKKDRAAGLRRLAIAQLGSVSQFNDEQFWKDVGNILWSSFLKDRLLKKLAATKSIENFLDALQFNHLQYIKCVCGPGDILHFFEKWDIMKKEKSKRLHVIAEIYTQALIKQKIPGTKFLYLAKPTIKLKL